MSKVSTYLQSHIIGEVSVRSDVRDAFSTDAGVLQITPDMVVYPRVTNDIRKVARFAWQLAEKGHPLGITPRGGGTDAAGSSLGKGISLALAPHMHTLFEYDIRQRLIRLQPGVSVGMLQQSLALQNTTLKLLRGSRSNGTIGGLVANATAGMYATGGAMLDAIDQLEVVLANGDVLQTERISKRELNRRKGREGFEGDLYRGIDGLIDEYAETIAKIPSGDYTGYSAIADVRRKDGSFDLAPLFIGSQGTLGIISEMILKVQSRPEHCTTVAMVFDDREVARDAVDELQRCDPQFLEYIDGAFYNQAIREGKTYAFYGEKPRKNAVVLVAGFEAESERPIKKSLKRLQKTFSGIDSVAITTFTEKQTADVDAILDVVSYVSTPEHDEIAASSLYSGFGVPLSHLETFRQGLDALAAKERVELPLAGHVATGIYGVYPSFTLKKVGDKQKILKLIEGIAQLLDSVGGTLIAEGGEGIIKSRAVRSRLDEKELELYDAIRNVFDPLGTLNPGVKQDVDLKTIASYIRSEPSVGRRAQFGL